MLIFLSAMLCLALSKQNFVVLAHERRPACRHSLSITRHHGLRLMKGRATWCSWQYKGDRKYKIVANLPAMYT
jgi:hypothetical protein